MFSLKGLAVLLSFTSLVLSAPNGAIERCGSHLTDAEVRRGEELFAARKALTAHTSTPFAPNAPTTIKVYWNVISAGPVLAQGNIPDSQITASIVEMNRAYLGSGLSFALIKTVRRVNAEWFNKASNKPGGVSAQIAMKSALRQGSAADLNVYSVGFSEVSLLGYATFPVYYSSDPQNDGVVIKYNTVPGGIGVPQYNLGRTLVHEAGHWFGLLHTFQGGCYGSGDSVDDTPPEASPAYGCPVGRDTCPGGGLDPIRNYMDYTDDSCMDQFSPKQIVRIKEQLQAFRGVIV